VARVLAFGATARVELEGEGEPARRFEVELPRERWAALALAPGQPVRLVPARLRVFTAQDHA
jgi:sulfate transport system ATP-binding protein